ncbi:MAG: hypothetical protein QW209_06555 [Nitrososphaerota archaeon]
MKPVCKLCGLEFDSEDPSEEELLSHLFEKHLDLLIALGLGLRQTTKE